MITEHGKLLGSSAGFDRQQFQQMMKGELWRYSRRELDNVLSLTGQQSTPGPSSLAFLSRPPWVINVIFIPLNSPTLVLPRSPCKISSCRLLLLISIFRHSPGSSTPHPALKRASLPLLRMSRAPMKSKKMTRGRAGDELFNATILMLKLMENKVSRVQDSLANIQPLVVVQQQPPEDEAERTMMESMESRRQSCEMDGDIDSGGHHEGLSGGEERARPVRALVRRESDDVAKALAGLTTSIDKLSCKVDAVDQRVCAQGALLDQHTTQLEMLRCQVLSCPDRTCPSPSSSHTRAELPPRVSRYWQTANVLTPSHLSRAHSHHRSSKRSWRLVSPDTEAAMVPNQESRPNQVCTSFGRGPRSHHLYGGTQPRPRGVCGLEALLP